MQRLKKKHIFQYYLGRVSAIYVNVGTLRYLFKYNKFLRMCWVKKISHTRQTELQRVVISQDPTFLCKPTKTMCILCIFGKPFVG